jgi:integrase
MEALPKGAEAAKRFIKQLTPDPKKYLYFKSTTTPGLVLRITPKGKKVWRVRYSVRGSNGSQERNISIGHYSDTAESNAERNDRLKQGKSKALFTVKEAEQEAQRIKVAARDGRDPIAESEDKAKEIAIKRQQAKLEAMKSTTIQQLFDQWCEYSICSHKDGGKEAARWIRSKVLPSYAELKVQDFETKEFWTLINPMKKDKHYRGAIVLFSVLRLMFRFAVINGILERCPLEHIQKKDINPNKETERDRVLCEYECPDTQQVLPDELAKLFESLPHSGMPEVSQLAIHICLSTCCRIGELFKARWQDINLNRAEWYIPAENAKNGKGHLINLSDYALRHFVELHNLTGPLGWLFPSTRTDKHLDPRSLARQIRDRQQETPQNNRRTNKHNTALMLPRGQWTTHDLRRTGATLMGQLSVPGDVIEKCLNHTETNKVARIYNRSVPRDEMQNAWQKLGKELQRLNQTQETSHIKSVQNNIINIYTRSAQ